MKCEIKYAPTNLNEVLYPSVAVERRIKGYASKDLEGHILLWGPNRTSKTTIANLLPFAIDGVDAVIDDKTTDELLAIKDLKGYLSNACDCYVRLGSCSKYFLVLNEFDYTKGRLDKFWQAIDAMGDMLMVIITTNNPMDINKSIRSRFDLINIPAVPAKFFLPRAQQILQAEGLILPHSQVEYHLNQHDEFGELTRYLRCLDELLFLNKNGLPIPTPPKTVKPALTIVNKS
jgi:replication-associated recombination protein RarA